MRLEELATPCLLLDAARMDRNIIRLRTRMRQLGVRLRPHLKTAKCVEVAHRMMESAAGPATVSTLREAEQFAALGVRDITYAVGIAPDKLARIEALHPRAEVGVILDALEQAQAVAAHSRARGRPLTAYIEIDSDNHRSGIAPENAASLRQLAQALESGGARLGGVLTHAGASYRGGGDDALAAAAERERAAAVEAAESLRAAGFTCPVVSVGSTPTAHFARDLTGVTEVRAGVYVFMDLVMAGIGVCGVDDIALSVLATVIGHQRTKGWILVDAGWMALSRDRGTAAQPLDQGYGVVCNLGGEPFADLIVAEVSQEHGILRLQAHSGAAMPNLPIGARVRILPNHACATAAQFDAYHVLNESGAGESELVWSRFNGW